MNATITRKTKTTTQKMSVYWFVLLKLSSFYIQTHTHTLLNINSVLVNCCSLVLFSIIVPHTQTQFICFLSVSDWILHHENWRQPPITLNIKLLEYLSMPLFIIIIAWLEFFFGLVLRPKTYRNAKIFDDFLHDMKILTYFLINRMNQNGSAIKTGLSHKNQIN